MAGPWLVMTLPSRTTISSLEVACLDLFTIARISGEAFALQQAGAFQGDGGGAHGGHKASGLGGLLHGRIF